MYVMEYGQPAFVFEFPSKKPHLLPYADAPAPKSKDGTPKEEFTLETIEIQEGTQFSPIHSSILFSCAYFLSNKFYRIVK